MEPRPGMITITLMALMGFVISITTRFRRRKPTLRDQLIRQVIDPPEQPLWQDLPTHSQPRPRSRL